MGFDMKQFVKDRDSAFVSFVVNDDWEPVREYCRNYGIPMPDTPDVMAAGIYKAVQEAENIPDDVKRTAAIKCMRLGFMPFMMPVGMEDGT